MMEYVKDELIILSGGGIRSVNLQTILDECCPTEIHTAGILSENISVGKFDVDEMELKEMLRMLD